MVALAKLSLHMSVEEFLGWESGDGLPYQLVDGEPQAMAPAGALHGLLQAELCRLIGNHLREKGGSCKVVAAPGVVPRVLAAYNVRIPDLAVTCAKVKPGDATLIEPVLLIEILSPSDHAETWSNVWTYTSIPTAKEIVVLHTARIAAQVLRRAADGAWPDRTDDVADGVLVLDSIGLEIAMTELYADTGLAS